MRVWAYPVSEPGVFAVIRRDDDTFVIISDGLPADYAVACYARYCTVEERNWVRANMGLPPVEEDPTYSVIDKIAGGRRTWDRSMIPEHLLWKGPSPCPKEDDVGVVPPTSVG